MRMTVNEVAGKSGVSVRTLHFYDEIGLLKPQEINQETGYRYYGEEELLRLQQVLFFRELDFPLKEITQIMNTSDYDRNEALVKQRELLQLKRKRLDDIIRLLDASTKGDITMSFKEFDTSELEKAKNQYAKEAKERWGNTKAYQESEKKTAAYGKEEWNDVFSGMNELLKKFSEKLGQDPADEEVQELVTEWQQYITKTSYECTKEILAGLGQMYVCDERFTKNMDRYGNGTAKLISDAIRVYCK